MNLVGHACRDQAPTEPNARRVRCACEGQAGGTWVEPRGRRRSHWNPLDLLGAGRARSAEPSAGIHRQARRWTTDHPRRAPQRLALKRPNPASPTARVDKAGLGARPERCVNGLTNSRAIAYPRVLSGTRRSGLVGPVWPSRAAAVLMHRMAVPVGARVTGLPGQRVRQG